MTGIELIAKERKEQLEVHHISIQDDVNNNKNIELTQAAEALVTVGTGRRLSMMPIGWDKKTWDYMITKPYWKRLILAGAFCAAELDRLEAIKNTKFSIGNLDDNNKIEDRKA